MKWLPALLYTLFSFAALADDAVKPGMIPLHQAPSNVQIIDGKRFYSLQNVHRFSGDTNNPKALSVMHAPRPQGPVQVRHTLSLPPTPANNADGTPPAKGPQDQVLSIFAPEDKKGPPSLNVPGSPAVITK